MVAVNIRKWEILPQRVIDRTFGKCIELDGGCIVWPGHVNQCGYGLIGASVEGKFYSWLVHKVAYVATHGTEDIALHIDHLCRNRRCVNTEHLEAVTQQENNRRTWARMRAASLEELLSDGH